MENSQNFRGLGNLAYKKRLEEMRLYGLQKRKLRGGDLIVAFKYIRDGHPRNLVYQGMVIQRRAYYSL